MHKILWHCVRDFPGGMAAQEPAGSVPPSHTAGTLLCVYVCVSDAPHWCRVALLPGHTHTAPIGFSPPTNPHHCPPPPTPQDKEVPTITGNRRLVVKFRPSRRALGKVAEAMVPGLVDPASAANSDRGSGSMPCSHAGSYSNLAASAAAGSAAGHSRTSSNASLAVLQPGGGSSNALARAGSDASPTPDEAASARSGGSSIAGASSSRDLARVGSAASHGSLSVPDLPPGLTQQPQQLQQQFEDAAANRAFQAGGAPGGLSSAAAAAAAAVAAAAAAVASGSSDSNAAAAAHVAAAAAALAAVDAGLPQGPGLSGSELSLGDDVDIPEGKPSR
jgi:hypothetical protein